MVVIEAPIFTSKLHTLLWSIAVHKQHLFIAQISVPKKVMPPALHVLVRYRKYRSLRGQIGRYQKLLAVNAKTLYCFHLHAKGAVGPKGADKLAENFARLGGNQVVAGGG